MPRQRRAKAKDAWEKIQVYNDRRIESGDGAKKREEADESQRKEGERKRREVDERKDARERK